MLILKYIENGFVIVHYELQPSKPNKKKNQYGIVIVDLSLLKKADNMFPFNIKFQSSVQIMHHMFDIITVKNRCLLSYFRCHNIVTF